MARQDDFAAGRGVDPVEAIRERQNSEARERNAATLQSRAAQPAPAPFRPSADLVANPAAEQAAASKSATFADAFPPRAKPFVKAPVKEEAAAVPATERPDAVRVSAERTVRPATVPRERAKTGAEIDQERAAARPTSSRGEGVVPEAEWGLRPPPTQRAPTSRQLAGVTSSTGKSIVEEGITERSAKETAARAVSYKPTKASISSAQVASHIESTYQDHTPPRKLIPRAIEHLHTLDAHLKELEATHGTNEDVAPTLGEARDHISNARIALHDAETASFGRGSNQESVSKGRSHTATGMKHLSAAVDALTSPRMHGLGIEAPIGGLGTEIKNTDVISRVQATSKRLNFNPRGKKQNVQGIADEVYDYRNPEDKEEMDAMSSGRRNQRPGFDQNTTAGNVTGVRRERRGDRRKMDTLEAFTGKEGETVPATEEEKASVRPKNLAKARNTSSQSRINVDTANLTEGGATLPVVPLSKAGPGNERVLLPKMTGADREAAANRRRDRKKNPPSLPTKVVGEGLTKSARVGAITAEAAPQPAAPRIEPGVIPKGTTQGATAAARAAGTAKPAARGPAPAPIQRVPSSTKTRRALDRINKKTSGKGK